MTNKLTDDLMFTLHNFFPNTTNSSVYINVIKQQTYVEAQVTFY